MSDPFLVKICGLKSREAVDWSVAAGADLVGFVHFARSPRHLELDAIADLAGYARGRARSVLLTVDADDALLAALVEAAAPDVLQLHGHETPERVAAVRRRFGRPVAKALGIGSAADVAAARTFDGVADLLLFDAKPPKDATRPGGLGAVFDWSLLDDTGLATPFLLSGGSALGTSPRRSDGSGRGRRRLLGRRECAGVKDRGRILEFVQAARAAAEEATRRLT